MNAALAIKDDESFWWEAQETEVHSKVFAYVKSVEEQQWEAHQSNLRHARLYANCDLVGLDWTLRSQNTQREILGKVSENVVQSVIDTARSMIAKNRTRVTFQTEGANWSTQRRAKKLEKYIEATFRRLGVYGKGVEMFRDACVFGTGVLKVCEFDNQLCVERVLIDDIIVDENEARLGEAMQLHQRCFISKQVLKKLYPQFAEEIDRAHENDRSWTSYSRVRTGQIAVLESWRLPSSKNAKDGRHTITIEGADLIDETYASNSFPFVFYHWNSLPTGFYGQGLAEQLITLQVRINELNRFIDKCQDRISVPRVYVDVASKVLKSHLNNRIGEIVPIRGQKPIFETPPAVAPETYQRLERLVQRAHELAGITQMSASGRKPVGLESAVALREYNDIETQRFAIQAQRYEEAFLQLAQLIISVAKNIYQGGQDISESWNSRNFVEQIKWSDVDLEEDQYHMSVEAASILSRTPAGRLQQVIEMLQGGLISPEQGRKLLGHPDLEREMDLLTAAIEDIDAVIEKLREGEFEPPEPFQNLDLGIKRVQLAYLQDRREGAPEEVLQGYRDWIEQANFTLNPPQPVTPPGAAPQDMSPDMSQQMPPGGQGFNADAVNNSQPAAGLAPEAMQLQAGV